MNTKFNGTTVETNGVRSIYGGGTNASTATGALANLGGYPISNPSGFITGIENLVYTTGDQTISGAKTFNNDIYIKSTGTNPAVLYVESGRIGINNEYPQASLDISGSVFFSERPFVNSIPFMLSGDINTSNFYTNNNPSGFITGVFQPNPDYVSIPDLSAKAGVPMGPPLDRVSSILYSDGSFPSDDISYGLAYGNTYAGQAFKWNYIYRNSDGLYVEFGNAIVTGGEYPWNVSYNNGVVVTKEAAARLISTLSGSASEGSSIYAARADHIHIFPTASEVGAYSINNPSGFITGIENLVYTTGDQNISGVKNFIQRPTVNGTGILLEGEVQNNTIISGVLYSAQVNVKNNHTGTLYKGQPVYINGAAGGNILVGLASNTGEASSSKTLGLIYQDSLAVNAFGTVITDGLLSNFNVGSAAAGDPIWLGPTGNLIYGLANKPVAPNHLVYLGVVTRTNNNGEVFVKVQNGYELDELHDVNVKNSPTGQFLFKNIESQWSGKYLQISDVSGLESSLNQKQTAGDYYLNSNPSGFISSNIVGLSGASSLANILQITQSGYNAIVTPATGTLYIIVG